MANRQSKNASEGGFEPKAKNTRRGKNDDGKQASKKEGEKPNTRKYVIREKGERADYTPRAARAVPQKKSDHYVGDVNKLVDGIVDNEQYLIKGAYLCKETRNIKNGDGIKTGDYVAIVFMGAIPGHELLMQGLSPGAVNISTGSVFKPEYLTSSKVEVVVRQKTALHKFLRSIVISNPNESLQRQTPALLLAKKTINPEPSGSVKEMVDSVVQTYQFGGESPSFWEVSEQMITGGRCLPVIHLRGASERHELKKVYMEKRELFQRTFLSVGQLHAPVFSSKIEGEGREVQEVMYNFLRRLAKEEGISLPEIKKPKASHINAIPEAAWENTSTADDRLRAVQEKLVLDRAQASSNLSAFARAEHGMYAFPKKGPAFVIKLGQLEEGKPLLFFRGVQEKHPLFEICKDFAGFMPLHFICREEYPDSNVPEKLKQHLPALRAIHLYVRNVLSLVPGMMDTLDKAVGFVRKNTQTASDQIALSPDDPNIAALNQAAENVGSLRRNGTNRTPGVAGMVSIH